MPILRRPTLAALSASFALSAACGGGSGGATPPAALPGTPVGPAGGVVESAGGTARLEVPAGALTATVRLSLEVARTAPLDPRVAAGTAYAVLPAGTTFAAPATLSIAYAPAARPSGTPEDELELAAAGGDVWDAVAGGTLDLAARRATGPVGGAGTFAVRWRGPSAPCTTPEDRQFDFWTGSWNFSAPDSFPGTDDVTADATGCLLEEVFEDTSRTVGRSVSLYSRLDGKWHQTYVDTRGGRIAMSGGLEGGRMVLYETATFRYVWEPIAGGDVQFGAEEAANADWSVVFTSTYAPR